MTDKRYGSWSPERRKAHAKRMTQWAEDRRKLGAVPGPAVRLRELQEKVLEISGRMSLADSALRTGWAAELRSVVGALDKATPSRHEPGCKLAAAMRGTMLVECEHGYDVCPKCDPCTCTPKPPEAYPP